jgi:hypothetical protein
VDKVKNLMAAGAPLPDAVRIALGDRTLGDVAEDRDLNRQNISSCLNGTRVPNVGEINAMVIELGGTFEEWRDLFAEAAAARVRTVAPVAAQPA